MRVRVQFDMLTCRVVGDDGVDGKAEPFLWPVYFRIDADAIHDACSAALQTADITSDLGVHPFTPGQLSVLRIVRDAAAESLSDNPHGWLVVTSGHHGNLGAGMALNTTRIIPEDIGLVDLLVAVPTAGFLRDQVKIGYAVALLEDDGTPGMAEYYREDFATKIKGEARKAILRQILGTGSSSAFSGFLTGDEAASLSLQGELKKAFKLALDDVIGAAVRTFDLQGLGPGGRTIEHRWTKKTGSEDGAFNLHGKVTIEAD
ncbi:MAG: hypothetical protein U0359_39415 [Byssovorax sp.]